MISEATLGTGVAAWIITYLIHSTLLIGAAWLAARWLRHRPRALDALWKAALLGGLLTASLQLGLGVAPWGGQLTLGNRLNTAPARLASLGASPAGPQESTASGARRAAPATPGLGRTPAPLGTAEPAGADAVGAALVESVPLTARAGPVGPARSAPAAAGVSPVMRHPAPRAPGADGSWPLVLFVAWLIVAGFLLLRLLWRWSRLHRGLGAGRREVTGEMRAALDELCRAARVRPNVRLTVSPALGAPVAMGVWRREICVPPRAATDLPSDCQRSLLAHELAHLVRRDPAWRLLGGVIERLFFFQPLNRLANRRLAACTEYLCDDWAASRDVRPLALARTLAEVAGWVVGAPKAGPVATMGVRRSELRQRVERLVEPRRPESVMRRGMTVVLTAILALIVVGAPGASRGGLARADDPPTPAPPLPPPPALHLAQAPSPPDLPDKMGPPAPPTPAVPPPAAVQPPPPPPPPARPAPVDPAKVALTVRAALKGIPSAARIRKQVREALKGVPSAAKLRGIVRKALKNVPSAAQIRKHVREALKGVPSAAKIRKHVREALKSIPSAAKLRRIIRGAMKGIGKGPHSAEARRAVRQALKVLEKINIGRIVRDSVGGALKAIPSAKRISGIVSRALRAVPSAAKISGIVERALSSVGNIGDIVGKALKAIPSANQLSKIVNRAVRAARRTKKR